MSEAIFFSSRSRTHTALSNFHLYGPDGKSVEVAYQLAKTRTLHPLFALWAKDRFSLCSPREAKSSTSKTFFCAWAVEHRVFPTKAEAGRQYDASNARWQRDNFDVMMGLLHDRYNGDAASRHALLSTGDAELHETIHRSPNVWTYRDGKEDAGGDMMGRMLMHVREDLHLSETDPRKRTRAEVVASRPQLLT